LNQNEILPLLEQSRYFALFSVHEGLSFALLEAMAAGTPPIASRINGNEVVISDNFDGYLVDVDDMEICKKQIEKIFLLSKDYPTISNRAIDKIRNKYSLESTLLKTSAIILGN
jgi:glycosyltransferase involved in cell wall biosynthesis